MILGLAFIYGYFNGIHGSASIVAPLISARALPPRRALFLAAVGVTIGPFILGSAVASTIGAELLRSDAITTRLIIIALVTTIL